MKVMCSKVESEVHAFSLELEKFAARWHQLKPGDQLLEGDKEACSGALSSLKERRAEFDELMATASRLRWADCQSTERGYTYLVIVCTEVK